MTPRQSKWTLVLTLLVAFATTALFAQDTYAPGKLHPRDVGGRLQRPQEDIGGILMSPAKDQTNAVMRVAGSYWVRVLVVFTAYFVAGKVGLSTPFTSNNISPVWPAAGVALSAVLLFGYRIWPGIAAAALQGRSAAREQPNSLFRLASFWPWKN